MKVADFIQEDGSAISHPAAFLGMIMSSVELLPATAPIWCSWMTSCGYGAPGSTESLKQGPAPADRRAQKRSLHATWGIFGLHQSPR